jgi:hypothetical protein
MSSRPGVLYITGIFSGRQLALDGEHRFSFGLHGKIWNQVRAEDALGTRGWSKSGVDKYPPIVARAVFIDVAKSKGMDRLPDSRRHSSAQGSRTTTQPAIWECGTPFSRVALRAADSRAPYRPFSSTAQRRT